MKTLTFKALAAGLLGLTVLTGCGGGSTAPIAAQAPTVTAVPAAEVVKYVAEIQASSTSESAEPKDITLVDMAVDDAAEPGAV